MQLDNFDGGSEERRKPPHSREVGLKGASLDEFAETAADGVATGRERRRPAAWTDAAFLRLLSFKSYPLRLHAFAVGCRSSAPSPTSP